jgi:cyclophilin family peptidyl-prolyl cis-trans isomerase
VTRSKLLALLLAATLMGCSGGAKSDAPDASRVSTPPSVALPSPRRVLELVSAEHRRDANAISGEDLASRDVVVRRTAVRALSRIADARSAELLGRALADEDSDVVAWSAYGLGYACKGREPATVRALAVRAASLFSDDASKRAQGLEAFDALCDALARCGNGDAERTLRGWLDTRHAERAALALGKLASRHGRLEDASIVALLDAASRPNKPLDSALFAFTRLGPLGASIQTRLLEVARAALKRPGLGRRFAVRALGRAGPDAAKELARVLSDARSSAAERSDAARELARLGNDGQRALAEALPALAHIAQEPGALSSSQYGPLSAALEVLTSAPAAARETLNTLAALPVAATAAPALRRRIVRLRCRAAALLAGRATLSGRLVACDPDRAGRLGALAVVSVLDRGPLSGARYRRWRELAESSDRVVRQAALALMPAHPEIVNPQQVLAKALHAAEPGTIAAAAEVLAAYPDRASAEPSERRGEQGADAGRPALKTHAEVITGLTAAFDRADDKYIETRSTLIDAAGALQLLSMLPRIEHDCKSSYPTLRQHAVKALGLLAHPQPCDTFTPLRDPPRELAALATQQVRLRFETDAGSLLLTLDPALAPVAVTRVVELAKSGFYNGVSVHRVVPGFVAQFGDPGGDGYGGANAPPLRCETSPESFDEGAVGVALAGRDTGSSQIFVTLGPYPHLDGDYPLIGHAGPGWDNLAQGDLVHKVTLE